MLAGQAADGLSALIGTERVQKGDSSTREGGVEREGRGVCVCVCVSGAARWGQSGNELSAEVKKSANQPCRGTLVLRSVYSDQFMQRKTMCVLIVTDKRECFHFLIAPKLPVDEAFGICPDGSAFILQMQSRKIHSYKRKSCFQLKTKSKTHLSTLLNTTVAFSRFPLPDAFFTISYFQERR